MMKSLRFCHSTIMALSMTLVLAHILYSDAAYSARRRVVASSSKSANAKYDRSITTFSEDGKLLQVEYGMEASNRGATVACIQWDDDSTNKNNVSTVVLVLAVDNSNTTTAATQKIHRLDAHCLLITTGLAGDGRALAHSARISCQRMRLGNGETPTISEIAEEVARTQHKLTTTAGARPFGVTATVVGMDEEGERTIRLFQSEPGGIVDEYVACAAGRNRQKVERELVRVRKDVTTLSDVVGGVAETIFSSDKSCESVDIFVIETQLTDVEESNSGMRIRCAKRVGRHDLEEVKEVFGGMTRQ